MPHGQLVLGDPIGDVGHDLLRNATVDQPQGVKLPVRAVGTGRRETKERPRVVVAHPEAKRHSGAVSAGELVEQRQAQPGKSLVELLDERPQGVLGGPRTRARPERTGRALDLDAASS